MAGGAVWHRPGARVWGKDGLSSLPLSRQPNRRAPDFADEFKARGYLMILEKSQIAAADLPIDGLKAHLKLGSAFDLDTVQDDLLAGFLRAAIKAVEHRISASLLIRSFEWRPMRLSDEMILPFGPLVSVDAVETWAEDGTPVAVPRHQYSVRTYMDVPTLRCPSLRLPNVSGASVQFTAGMAQRWDVLPADLGQAVMMLAAHYYEFRNDTGLSEGCMPFGVHSLLQRHRSLRLSFGGRTHA